MSDSTAKTRSVDIVAEEVFIKLESSSTPSKTVRVMINNFLNNIKANDEEKPETRIIESPEFEIARFKFRINVDPEWSPGYLGVFLYNDNDPGLHVSLHIKVKRNVNFLIN